MSRILASLLLLTAPPALGQVMVNGPQGCALVAGLDSDAVFQAIDEDHMVFHFHGLEAIEYRCAFEPAFDPYWEEGEVQTRIGYCMEPGPYVTPGVFTLMDRGDGTMQLDMSFAQDPVVLDICTLP